MQPVPRTNHRSAITASPPAIVPPTAKAGRPAAGPTLVEWAYDHLLEMLMTVQIAPGERIAIDTVARQLGISQTPIREALSQLEAEKLVSKMPNVGYRASPRMSREEVQDLYALRLLIEPYAAARAAEKMDDETLVTLQEIDEGMRGVAEGNDRDFARFAEADAKLHRLIATGSGNRLIAETIERLHAHLQIFRSLYSTNAPEEAAAEHQRIIEALMAHDPAAAEEAVREHLKRSQERMDRASAGAAAE
ncbi:GntR family transcriptional regulator [Sphingomonas sp.]|uniref:GntR family transcriptional regulator n=1 Tax=Sphingomonas sp. TaxID=28214 RepID=UPI003B3A8614